jgi:hypothetical protein
MEAFYPNPDPLYYGDYSESGVDRTLLREMLRLTPFERLIKMDQHARHTLELLEYGRKHREATARRSREASSQASS